MILLLSMGLYKLVLKTKIDEQRNHEDLIQLAEHIIGELGYASVSGVRIYPDSYSISYAIEQSYLDRYDPETVREFLHEYFTTHVCTLLDQDALGDDFVINIIAGPNGGPMYDKRFSKKRCS